MIDLNIEYDYKDANERLEALGISLKNVGKKILKKITSKTKKKIVKEFKKKYKSTGLISEAIYGSAKKNHVGYVGILSKKAYIYKIKETGGTIKPRKRGNSFLTFKIGDKWIKTKEVKIKANPFVNPTFDKYVRSQEYKKDIDKVVASIVKREMKKRALSNE